MNRDSKIVFPIMFQAFTSSFCNFFYFLSSPTKNVLFSGKQDSVSFTKNIFSPVSHFRYINLEISLVEVQIRVLLNCYS